MPLLFQNVKDWVISEGTHVSMLCSWKVPTMVAWGESDKHLPKSEAEKFVKTNPDIIKSVMLAGAGHLPQEDW